MRSKLFVPAARPDFFAKALASDADALSFDLEDSVPPDAKASARARLSAFLASDALRDSAKTIIVRVNDPAGPDFGPDLAAIAGHPVALVNVPKVDDPAILHRAAAAVGAAFADHAPPRLLVNIETPAALLHAPALASAHPMVAGLQVGLNDLFTTLGADRRPEHAHAALWQIRLAAAGADTVFAYDGAWADVADTDGFAAEAELARSLGYLGKSCIHPRQVAIANAVFDRSDALAAARRLVAAADEAARDGRGAFLLDGRMIDGPAIRDARAAVAAAEAHR